MRHLPSISPRQILKYKTHSFEENVVSSDFRLYLRCCTTRICSSITVASALNKSNTLPCATYKSPYFYGPCAPFKSPCNDCNCRTEAIAGALPLGKNSPQKPPYGLYAEKLSGTAFTAPRHSNQQSWLYRILPSVAHSTYKRADSEPNYLSGETLEPIPNQLRRNPFDIDEGVDWVRGHDLYPGPGVPR